MTLLVAALAGLAIGLSLGALGSGGSILAVPVLVYLLDQSPVAATTGSLVVVAAAAVMGAVLAHRGGHVRVGQGLAFALLGTVGAAVGATWSVHVDPTVLMGSFAVLLLIVAATMIRRLLAPGASRAAALEVDAPIISVTPTFMCDCPGALKMIVAGSAVGLLTGFLGVGGGFLVVPALVLALGLSMPTAVGTSLLVIAVNSLAAFGVRMAHGVTLDWPPLLLTAMAVTGSIVGRRVAGRVDPHRLGLGFVGLLVVVGGYTAVATFA